MGRHRQIFYAAFEFIAFCDVLFFLFLVIFRSLSDFSVFFLSGILLLFLSCFMGNDLRDTYLIRLL